MAGRGIDDDRHRGVDRQKVKPGKRFKVKGTGLKAQDAGFKAQGTGFKREEERGSKRKLQSAKYRMENEKVFFTTNQNLRVARPDFSLSLGGGDKCLEAGSA